MQGVIEVGANAVFYCQILFCTGGCSKNIKSSAHSGQLTLCWSHFEKSCWLQFRAEAVPTRNAFARVVRNRDEEEGGKTIGLFRSFRIIHYFDVKLNNGESF